MMSAWLRNRVKWIWRRQQRCSVIPPEPPCSPRWPTDERCQRESWPGEPE